MPRYVALLRGINVGGRNRVAMADLRALATSLGHADVQTYVQSGNVVFDDDREDPDALADGLQNAIAQHLDVAAGVVVLSRAQLSVAAARNPFPDFASPKHVHALFRRSGFDDREAGAALAAALERVAARGARDEAAIVAGTLYLHTPGGYGRSELGALVGRGLGRDATGRNWSTVTALLEMVSG